MKAYLIFVNATNSNNNKFYNMELFINKNYNNENN
jgi:hypothetical protein